MISAEQVKERRGAAVVAGRVVRYAALGRGAPLLLIHGLSGSRAWWRRNVRALASSNEVIVFDLPGFGSRWHFRSNFELERASEWLHAFITSLRLPRAHVAGHSMGGMLALAHAAEFPQEVDRLVLVAPAVDLEPAMLRWAIPLVMAARTATPLFLPQLALDAMRAGPFTLWRTGRALLGFDLRHTLPGVKTPTLIVGGQRDALIPRSSLQLLRRTLPSSRLLMLAGAGHVPMFDRPAAFNAVVQRFLAGETVGE